MKRLIEIQNELKAPKNQRNNFGGYNYRSCEDILEAVKPLLKKQGLLLIVSDDITSVNVGYEAIDKVATDKLNEKITKNEYRVYVKATASLYDADTNKKVAETTAFAREEEVKKGMDASQITGSASSYARKYALNGLFAIDDTKDADAINTHNKEVKQAPKKQEVKNDDILAHIENIKSCTDRSELELYWATLTANEQKNADIVKVFKEMGKKYPKE